MSSFKFQAILYVGISTLVGLLQLLGATQHVLLNWLAWQQPWRFVTAIFAHGDIGHFLYNMFALALFGSILEKKIGYKGFTLIFWSAGLLGSFIGVFMYPSSLGASGAIYGILGALIVVAPTMMIWAFGVPLPMWLAGIGYIFIDIIGMLAQLSNTGYVVHLTGLSIGILLGFSYRKPQPKQKKQQMDNTLFNQWEQTYMKK
ncbi:MAG: rhomboid family intramembrane serine protease [Candidatus Woesearchaeota archaeon]